MKRIKIEYRADHPAAIPVLAEWFAAAWGDLHPENTLEGFIDRLHLYNLTARG